MAQSVKLKNVDLPPPAPWRCRSAIPGLGTCMVVQVCHPSPITVQLYRPSTVGSRQLAGRALLAHPPA